MLLLESYRFNRTIMEYDKFRQTVNIDFEMQFGKKPLYYEVCIDDGVQKIE
ncbi:MAG: hypothetical protein GX128_05690 [Bacteroidales bacterium]|jgi:hypothetical protein|nr:hypothetical protein [Bacteroidales bacterium]